MAYQKSPRPRLNATEMKGIGMELLKELKPRQADKRSANAKLSRRVVKVAGTALDVLEEIMTEEGVKTGDRISAVKLAFDILKQQTADEELSSGDGVYQVVIHGMEQPLCE